MTMAKECKIEKIEKVRRKAPSLRARRRSSASFERALLPEEAIQEAERCLGLRDCQSCDLCSLLCPDLCITRDEETGEVLIDLDYCKGCGICAAVCPKGAIEMVLEESR